MAKRFLVACPFCGRALHHDSDGDRFSLYHAKPTCRVWNETDDSLAFVIKVRERLGLPIPGERN